MAVATVAVTGSSTTDATSVALSTFQPLIGDLLVLILSVTGVGGLNPNAMVVTSSVANVPRLIPVGSFARQSADGNSLITAWVGGALELLRTTRVYTVNFNGITMTGTCYTMYRISGMARSGLGAIRQMAFENVGGAAHTPAPVFPAACLTGNPCITGITNASNPAAITPPAGFTEGFDQGYGTPTTGFEVSHRNSGNTVTTLTYGGASASAFGALAIELDTRTLSADDTVPVELGWGGLQGI